jgi:hypothetical protein
MNLTRNLVIVLFTFIKVIVYSQNTDQEKKNKPADDYARSSISFMLLDFQNTKYSEMIKKASNGITFPAKFDSNQLNKTSLTFPDNNLTNNPLTTNIEKIRQSLVSDKFAIDVVKYWWQIKNDGSYSTSLIEKRGKYNSTDQVVAVADATKVGRARLCDLGLNLIGNTYVLVLDYHDLKPIHNVLPFILKEEKHKQGFKGKITAYLYKINYPDTVQAYFDASFINDKKIDLVKLNKIFDQVYSPVIFVTSETRKIRAASKNKSLEEIMKTFVNKGVEKTIDKIETRLEVFRVKEPITNLSPIKSKIGRKESLKHERRYYVWQYVESHGLVVARKKGEVRAKKVVDNRNDELGKTQESSFYQIGGGKIKQGMTLQERKDLGLGVSAGYGSFGMVLQGDLNIGKIFDLPVRQLKIYAGSEQSFLQNPIYHSVPNALWQAPADNAYDLQIVTYGLLKEFNFARNFMTGIRFGYAQETLKWKAGNYIPELNATGYNWGLSLGTNLFSSSLQVIGNFNAFHYGKVGYNSGTASASTNLNWEDIFPTMNKVSFSLSLRLNL